MSDRQTVHMLFACILLTVLGLRMVLAKPDFDVMTGIKVDTHTTTSTAEKAYGIYVAKVTGGAQANTGIYTESRVVTPAGYCQTLPLLTEDDADWETGNRDVDSYHALKAVAKLQMHRHNKTGKLLPRRSSLREVLPSAYDATDAVADLMELVSTLLLAVRHLAYETETERNCRIQGCGVNVCHGGVCGLGCPEPCTKFNLDGDTWKGVPPDGELSARKPPVDHSDAFRDYKEWLTSMESQRTRTPMAEKKWIQELRQHPDYTGRLLFKPATQLPEEKPWEAARMSREDYEKLSEYQKRSLADYSKFVGLMEKLKLNAQVFGELLNATRQVEKPAEQPKEEGSQQPV